MLKNIIITFSLTFGAIPSSIAATTIIDGAARNGGFESGAASPWGGLSVVTDATIARSGSSYGYASGNRVDVFQFIPISNANGLEFALTFWARIPDSDGFDSLSVSFSDTGFSKNATVTTLSEPSFSSSEWRKFEYQFTTPNNWDDSGNSKLSIKFPNSASSRIAFLDDVNLTQIPEPSSVLTLSIAAILLLTQRIRCVSK